MAAGSVTRIWSVDITVNGLGVELVGVGAGGSPACGMRREATGSSSGSSGAHLFARAAPVEPSSKRRACWLIVPPVKRAPTDARSSPRISPH